MNSGETSNAKAGTASARALKRETAKEERRIEAETGHDLKKGADRVEERARSAGVKDAAATQKTG
jgi:cell division protein FtsB